MAEYGEPVHGYIRSLNKGEARWHLCLFLRKAESQDTYVLTDGVQIVQSKRIRRTDQDWSKYLAILFVGVPDTLWRQNYCHREKSRSILPVAQTDIPREHVMLKFRKEDAEAVMANSLEGGSDSEKALFPEPTGSSPAGNSGRDSEKRWKWN